MIKVLLLGGSGFIGKNVIEYYQNSDIIKIVAPTSKELNCIDEESVYDYLVSDKFDIVLNFALYINLIDKTKDNSKILDYNLLMYYNFAKYNYLYKRMFYLGSGAEYDKSHDIKLVKEEDVGRYVPVDQYGLMKYIVGKDIENSNNIYNLRLFGIFGKYENYAFRFISNMCCKHLLKQNFVIRQNVYFNYLYIIDFLNILNLFINAQKLSYHTYNVVNDNNIDLVSICNIINKINKTNYEILVCKKDLAKEYTANNERLHNEFKNLKFMSYEDSIGDLYSYYLTHIKTIDKEKIFYN